MEESKELKQITNQVKEQILDLEVAPPLLYKALFNDLMTKNNVVIEDEELLVNSILDKKIAAINAIQQNTSRGLNKLDEGTKEAISAIKEKDEKRLEAVLEEMQLLRKEVEKLKRSVFTDTLTKAHNRQWLYAKYISGSELLDCKGVLVLIDMNDFKNINDVYGHLAGDKVLEFISLHLKKTRGDVIRYGGDEFLIIFKDETSADVVDSVMQKNREQLMTKELRFKEHKFHTTYSYGMKVFKKGDNFQDILSNVDTLMYEDKERIKKEKAGS